MAHHLAGQYAVYLGDERLILPAGWCLLAGAPFGAADINLHMAICRLFQQKDARRPAAKDQETWVERVMQEVKENLNIPDHLLP